VVRTCYDGHTGARRSYEAQTEVTVMTNEQLHLSFLISELSAMTFCWYNNIELIYKEYLTIG